MTPSSTTTFSSPSSSLEARLSALEQQVGTISGGGGGSGSLSTATTPTPTPTTTTLTSRLDGLQASATSVLSQSSNSNSNSNTHTTPTPTLRDTWKESLKLLEDLDPGMALTHQQQPLLYKRQQVLAAATSLETDFGELRKLQHALLGGGGGRTITTTTNNNTKDMDQAPILTDYKTPDQRRLETCKWTVSNLAQRTQVLSMELDQLLEVYHQCMTAASEKCVMAEETIRDGGTLSV
jgi:hypothetical protein